MIYLFFEQSGTFKKEFKNLGYDAKDFDIENQFGETDLQCDLFEEIEKEYEKENSGKIIKNITKDDILMCFFPCIKFSQQNLLNFTCNNYGFRKWPLEKRLEHDLQLHDELNHFYKLITKLVLICLRKKIKLIIENPYGPQHYLTRYWCLKPSIIDYDRTKDGDYFKKPTQYWFVNFEPKNNLLFDEPLPCVKERKQISKTPRGINRSLISSDYARRFIKKYIL